MVGARDVLHGPHMVMGLGCRLVIMLLEGLVLVFVGFDANDAVSVIAVLGLVLVGLVGTGAVGLCWQWIIWLWVYLC